VIQVFLSPPIKVSFILVGASYVELYSLRRASCGEGGMREAFLRGVGQIEVLDGADRVGGMEGGLFEDFCCDLFILARDDMAGIN
jgi:hypothetical protein